MSTTSTPPPAAVSAGDQPPQPVLLGRMTPPALPGLEQPAAQDRAVAGGKAAPLAMLAAAGIRVPESFIVPAAVYRDAVAPLRPDIDALLAGASDPASFAAAADQIANLLQGRASDDDLSAAVGDACAHTFGWEAGRGMPVAVRSSATLEDLQGASFAGQYDTVLGVRDLAAAIDAVRRCWTSYWSARAIEYRRERGLDHWAGAMAVLVQRLIEADAAGVAFTAEPATGFRYLITVNAALGLGQGVVDGAVPADSFAVDKDRRAVVLRAVSTKTHRIALAADGGTARQDVPGPEAAAPSLTDAQLLALADVAVDLERRLGVPQDVEWAWRDGTLYLLQSRPITALPPDPLQSFPVRWDVLEERTWHWKRSGDEPAPPLREDLGRFGSLAWVHTAHICGRKTEPRVRHLHGYRYTTDRAAFPTEEARLEVQRAFEAHVDSFWEAGRHLGQDEHLAELVASNQQLFAFDRAAASDAALADHLEDAGRAFVRSWTLHWVFVTAAGYGAAPDRSLKDRWKRAYRDATGDENPDAPDALLEGLPNKLTDAVERLSVLAEICQRHPPLRHAIETREPATFLAALDEDPAALPGADTFRAAFRALLAAQGLRCGAGFGSSTDPLTPSWLEEPSLVVQIVRHYLHQDLAHLRTLRAEVVSRQQERLAQARARVGDDPERRDRFERAYAAASAGARWFEDHNYHIDSAAQSLHRLALAAAGRRLIERGELDALDDVRWLHLADLTAALRSARADAPDLRDLVAENKAVHERRKALVAPPWLGAPPPPPAPKPEPAPTVDAPANGEAAGDDAAVLIRGQTGSRGIATGRVRIVAPETPVPDVARGDVLVARNAGPLWTPVFPTLAAIVLDEGVFSQHAMLTAREYRVPAVFQTKTATKDLEDGQTVVVDGTRGLVLRPDQPGEPAKL